MYKVNKNLLIIASIITGLFRSQNQSRKISQDLERAGFRDSDYIVYLTEGISKEVKTSVWQSFFRDNITLEDDSLVVSVKVKGSVSTEILQKIFDENNSIH